jgi:hypothetical protein
LIVVNLLFVVEEQILFTPGFLPSVICLEVVDDIVVVEGGTYLEDSNTPNDEDVNGTEERVLFTFSFLPSVICLEVVDDIVVVEGGTYLEDLNAPNDEHVNGTEVSSINICCCSSFKPLTAASSSNMRLLHHQNNNKNSLKIALKYLSKLRPNKYVAQFYSGFQNNNGKWNRHNAQISYY